MFNFAIFRMIRCLLPVSITLFFTACIEQPIALKLDISVIEACADGIDNDHDGWIDLNDNGCSGINDADEAGGTSSICNDGLDNDGDGYIDSADSLCHSGHDNSESLSFGDVLITELLANPQAVSDADGEWLELYNNTADAIDIYGWVLSDNDRQHQINQSLMLAANSYLVLSRSDNNVNGLAPLHASDYVYDTLQLTNGGGSASLHNAAGDLIWTLAYDQTQVAAGASWSLDGEILQQRSPAELAQAAKQSTHWCFSNRFITGSSGDKGTPGLVNNDC